MTREQALDILCALNEWRRYDGPIGEGPVMPSPMEVGQAIDIAIEILGQKEVSVNQTENPSAWTIEQLMRKELCDEPSLSRRARLRVERWGVGDVWELAGWSRGKVMQIRNLGKKSFDELGGVLKKYGLDWGMWESESYKHFCRMGD